MSAALTATGTLQIIEDLAYRGQLAPVIGVGLARPEVAHGPQALDRVGCQDPEVCHRRQRDRGKPGVPCRRQRSLDVRGAEHPDQAITTAETGEETAARMGMHVHPRRPGRCHGSRL